MKFCRLNATSPLTPLPVVNVYCQRREISQGYVLRILYHHRVTARLGQAVHIDELVKAFRQAGHEVMVVGPRCFSQARFGAGSGIVATLKSNMPRALYEIVELNYSIPAFARLALAYWRFRPDVVYERCNLFLLAGFWLKRLTGVPLLMEVNSPFSASRAQYDRLALRRLAAWSERTVWRGADIVLPVTHVLAGYVQRAGVPDQRIRVVPNGVDPRLFAGHDSSEAKRRLGLAGRLVLGFTGFVRPWHRLEQVVDLMAAPRIAADDWHLLIVGDGDAVPALKGRAKALGLADRLTITGVVPRDQVACYIAAFDIALQPGITEYASPLKLFEYMAMGKAIIAPDAPNIREVLTPEANAALFDPCRPADFSEVILLLAGDPALRARIGAEAFRTVVERPYTWSHNAAVVVNLAERLASINR